MSRWMPRYITSVQADYSQLHYEWDEWRVKDIIRPAPESLVETLSPLRDEALVALTIAEAEWIAWRFSSLSNDGTLPLFLEAAWAANLDLGYTAYFETSPDDWRGPVRGPMNVALTVVMDALFCKDERPVHAVNPGWLSNLAVRVLPDPAPFLAWRDFSIARLLQHYRKPPQPESLFDDDPEPPLPVPPEVFDPAEEFVFERAGEALDRYLSELDPDENPFLRSAAEMAELGFEGVAYRYTDTPRE
jgi:hypothetical protein